MLSDLGATAATNPERIQEAFEALMRIEGTAANLRGPLLELVAAHVLKEVEEGSIVLGRVVIDRATGKKADIDVQLMRPDNAGLLCVECKAKEPGGRVGVNDAKHWRNDRVPVMLAALRGEPRYAAQSIRFELWTNANIDAQALAWLKQHAKSTDECELGWKDGANVRAYSGKAKSAAIAKILNDHFYERRAKKRK